MKTEKSYGFSFWEKEVFLAKCDLVVVGGGIVGLSTALAFKALRPNAKIVVIEGGMLPRGASTRNAGFACFGSISELVDDFNQSTEDAVVNTLKMRLDGLTILRKRLGDQTLNYRATGGIEVFKTADELDFFAHKIKNFNEWIEDITGLQDTYSLLTADSNDMPVIRKSKGYIFNQHEGLLHPGLMMYSLQRLCQKNDINIYYGSKVNTVLDEGDKAVCQLDGGQLLSDYLLVATNGFAGRLIDDIDLQPARNQVLLTEELKDNPLKAGYHFDRGFVYFRPVGRRILIGGGRHLDIEGETTSEFGTSEKIKSYLEEFLRDEILNGKKTTIEHEWSGILGVGKDKSPIIRMASPRVGIAVRMGGMGVAIGSIIGTNAAQMIHEQ